MLVFPAPRVSLLTYVPNIRKFCKRKLPRRPPLPPPLSSPYLPTRPPRASHSLQTALRGLHWFSSGHSSTMCVPVITPPHLHLSDPALPILNNHSFCGPLFVLHQVYADRAFLHHPSRPLFPPPLACALSLLAYALNPARVTTPSDSCPSMAVCLLILSASSLPFMSLCTLTHVMYVSWWLFSRASRVSRILASMSDEPYDRSISGHSNASIEASMSIGRRLPGGFVCETLLIE